MGYLVSQFVCWGFGQADGREVRHRCVLLGQLDDHLLVGHLDLVLQLLQELVHTVLGDGFPVPVLQVLDVCTQGKRNA